MSRQTRRRRPRASSKIACETSGVARLVEPTALTESEAERLRQRYSCMTGRGVTIIISFPPAPEGPSSTAAKAPTEETTEAVVLKRGGAVPK